MKLSDFDYELPPGLIAQYPPERRDDSRLILLERHGEGVRESRFSSFARYLVEGDLLLVNETRVIPARLFGRKETSARVEIFITRNIGRGRWRALCRPSKRLHPGDRVLIGDAGHSVTILEEIGGGEWLVQLPEDIPDMQFINHYGRIPLPPYIGREDEKIDVDRYQTLFARNEGSVAAPTAGLHFTSEVLRGIERRGCSVIPLTLHVGPGTFRPLEKEIVEDNILAPEYIMIRRDYWAEINDAKSSGRRIIAVGTTVTRALEALSAGKVSDLGTEMIEGEEYITGWTDLFIYPGFEFKVVDALLTNLHLPRSSLLVLVSAFAGHEKIMKMYRWAVTRRFRFYSYGDVMFIR